MVLFFFFLFFIIYQHRYIIIAILAIYLGVVAAIESNGENNSNVHYIAFSLMNLVLLPLWLLPYGMAVREEEEQLTLITNGNDGNNDNSSSAMLTTAVASHKDQTNGGSESSDNERNFTVCETLSQLDFWLLWVAHFCGTANGLFFINNISQISQSLGGAKSSAALYVSILSVANAVGRMSAGFLSDRYASTVLSRPMFFVVSLFLMFLGQGSLALVPSLNWLYVGCLIIGMSYGAFWALIPAMVIELFGAKNVGSNYQILSLAPAFGSVMASVVLSGAVYESHVMPHTNVCCGTACFRLTHVVTSLAALVGCALATMLWYRTRSFYTRMNGGGEMERGDYGEL